MSYEYVDAKTLVSEWNGIYCWAVLAERFKLYTDKECTKELPKDDINILIKPKYACTQDVYWELVHNLEYFGLYVRLQGNVYRIEQDGDIFAVEVNALWSEQAEAYATEDMEEELSEAIESVEAYIEDNMELSEDRLNDYKAALLADDLSSYDNRVLNILAEFGLEDDFELLRASPYYKDCFEAEESHTLEREAYNQIDSFAIGGLEIDLSNLIEDLENNNQHLPNSLLHECIKRHFDINIKWLYYLATDQVVAITLNAIHCRTIINELTD